MVGGTPHGSGGSRGPDEGREMSRRGLIGLFGRGIKGFSDALKQGEAAPQRAAAPAVPAASYPSYDRLLRPPEDTLTAEPDGRGGWTVDLSANGPEVTESRRVWGEQMLEPAVLVRAHENHLAACSSECPVDGSDVLWSHDEDRLYCPACESRWRLDGAHMGGPAGCDIGRYVIDELDDVARILEA